jgi:protocatechuate 3,4-dioxygenase beta subunit
MRWLAVIVWLLAGTGEADPGSRARMGPGMEVARTPATLAAGRGEPMLVTGTVRTADWQPVAGVRITAWQANARGRYGPNREHQCCYLTASVRTDSAGRYAFDTIVPSFYSGGGEPHIHLEVQGRPLDEILVEGRPQRLVHDIVVPSQQNR